MECFNTSIDAVRFWQFVQWLVQVVACAWYTGDPVPIISILVVFLVLSLFVRGIGSIRAFRGLFNFKKKDK